jgi:hypothetical protein
MSRMRIAAISKTVLLASELVKSAMATQKRMSPPAIVRPRATMPAWHSW